MTIEAAFTALVEANPIPDPRSYAERRLEPAAFLTATRERTVNMRTIETQEARTDNKQRRWQPLAAVAAFILVIAVGVAAALALRGTADVANVPAPPFETPQDVVDAYYAALNAGDGDAFVVMFAEAATDSEINPIGNLSDDKIRARIEAIEAVGATFAVVDCASETALRTRCTVSSSEPIGGLIVGSTEIERSVVTSLDEEGLIARMGVQIQLGAIDTAREQAHFAWMTENYRELLDEWRFQVWGSDPVARSGAEIAMDYLAASKEFDAQYDG